MMCQGWWKAASGVLAAGLEPSALGWHLGTFALLPACRPAGGGALPPLLLSCCPPSPVSLAGLWSLTYEQELTTPLHITASRGYVDCLRHLLLRGADVELAPGGQTALHVACAAAMADCVRLLLSFGADPEAISEDGRQPLHLCQSPASLP